MCTRRRACAMFRHVYESLPPTCTDQSASGVPRFAGARDSSVVADAVGSNMTSSVVHRTLVDACANIGDSCQY